MPSAVVTLTLMTCRNASPPNSCLYLKSLFSVMVVQETKPHVKQAKPASQLGSQSVSSGSTVIDKDRLSHKSHPIATSQRMNPVPSETRTPDQPTHPSDSKWSGSIIASKDGDVTKSFFLISCRIQWRYWGPIFENYIGNRVDSRRSFYRRIGILHCN